MLRRAWLLALLAACGPPAPTSVCHTWTVGCACMIFPALSHPPPCGPRTNGATICCADLLYTRGQPLGSCVCDARAACSDRDGAPIHVPSCGGRLVDGVPVEP